MSSFARLPHARHYRVGHSLNAKAVKMPQVKFLASLVISSAFGLLLACAVFYSV